MLTVMLSEKLVVKTFAAEVHAACAVAAFAPNSVLKLDVKVGLITKVLAKAGKPETRAIPDKKIPNQMDFRLMDSSPARGSAS